MKKILIAFIVIFTICISCTTVNFPKHPKWLCSKKYACLKHPRLEMPPIENELIEYYDNSVNDKIYESFSHEDTTLGNLKHKNSLGEGKILNGYKEKEREFTNNYNNTDNYRYEDFPNEDVRYGNILNEDVFTDRGEHRVGKIIDGYKEGKWISGDAGFDENGNVIQKTNIWREEYFKKGLRDSVFKQYDGNGKVIYETTFKMGTGFWKEFHSNGALYFEVYTKDGYFTDTLKLYNKNGELAEKRLYKKDSLIFKENMILDDFPTDNK